jgi:biotin carboxyl carrier protein
VPAYEVFIDGKPRKIEVTRNGRNLFTARVDDKSVKIELSCERLEAGKGFSIKLDGKNYKVEMPTIEWEKTLPLNVEGTAFKAELKTRARKTALTAFEPVVASPTKRNGVNKPAVEGAVVAPMTGKVVSVRVKQGDQVKAGQTLCVVEAMKMENEIAAVKAGVVKEVLVSEGSPVSEGEALFVLA